MRTLIVLCGLAVLSLGCADTTTSSTDNTANPGIATEAKTDSASDHAGHVDFVADADFKDVLASNETLVVDFTASWCAPCQKLKPELKKLAGEVSAAKFVMVDCTDSSTVAEEYGVTGLPTVIVFKDGKIAEKVVGFDPNGGTIDTIRTAIDG